MTKKRTTKDTAQAPVPVFNYPLPPDEAFTADLTFKADTWLKPMRPTTGVRVVNTAGLPLPAYKSEQAAGMDLRAAIDGEQEIRPLQRLLVPTGLFIALPPDHEAQVRPRSGLALEHGVTVLNAPGTIDADYRGEVKVLLVNLSDKVFYLAPGERIAQLVLAQHGSIGWVSVETLDETPRGTGGLGSTGRS